MNSTSRDPYFNSRRAKRILVTVFLLHLAIIVLPLIFASLTEQFEPRIIVMNVGMADLPAGGSLDSVETASSEPLTPLSEPELPPVDSFDDPTPPPELPPEVKQPEPVLTTQTKTQPPKDSPKTQSKPDPQPKTQTPKDPPKTQTPKDPPKTAQYLSVEEIKVNRNTRTQAQIDAARKAREAAEAKAKVAAKEREALIAALRDAASQGVPGTPNPGHDGILGTKEMRDYYEQLNAFIKPQWKAVSPSSIELGGKVSTWPVVDLTIAKDGKVSKAVIVSKSGNKAVDDAVTSLLTRLNVVPVPPQACTIRVTLEIR